MNPEINFFTIADVLKEFFIQDPAFINEVVAYAMETTVLTAARAYKVSWTLGNLEN